MYIRLIVVKEVSLDLVFILIDGVEGVRERFVEGEVDVLFLDLVSFFFVLFFFGR